MAHLYLHCAICSRKQADGLLSGAAWGRTPLPEGFVIDHPAVRKGLVHVCPACIGTHRNWHALAVAAVGIAATA